MLMGQERGVANDERPGIDKVARRECSPPSPPPSLFELTGLKLGWKLSFIFLYDEYCKYYCSLASIRLIDFVIYLFNYYK